MQDIQLYLTKDGSHTLINHQLQESYHAYNGALTESEYVYIQHGLNYYFSRYDVGHQLIRILEFGFGTGLNALLTLQHSLNNGKLIQYTSLEPYPVSSETALKLNYSSNLNEPYPILFKSMHTCDWNKPIPLTDSFELLKLKQKLNDIPLEPEHFDVIYYDAFAPSKQPEAWDKSLLEKCYRALKTGGLLVSYCANGQFKRNLKSLGFTLDQIEGPMGRKEMTRAWK